MHLCMWSSRTVFTLVMLAAVQPALAGSASVGDCGPGTVRVCGTLTLKNTTGQDANDLHFYMYQNDRDEVQVLGAEVSAADCGTVSAALGTDDGTGSPPPGNHGAQVDMDNCNIPAGDSVQIEVCLCMNERNCIKFKDIEFTNNGAPAPPPPNNRPPNRGGWRIQRPIQGGSGGNRVPGGGGRGAQEGNGGSGNWIHIVCYENDSADWIIIDELKLLASPLFYTAAQLQQKWPNIDPVIDPANPYPICIPPGGRYCYNFETTGSYVGGHVYQRWSVRVDTAGVCNPGPIIQGADPGADPMTIVGDHPVEEFMLDCLPGRDFYVTTVPTLITFGSPVIPAIPEDFVGPGSLPFEGTIPLLGLPLDPAQSDVDTVIERQDTAYLDNDGDTTSISIEMEALQLRSIAPIPIPVPSDTPNWFDVLPGMDLTAPGQPPTQTAMSHFEGGGDLDAIFIQGLPNATPPMRLQASDAGGPPGVWSTNSHFNLVFIAPPPFPSTAGCTIFFDIAQPSGTGNFLMPPPTVVLAPTGGSLDVFYGPIELGPLHTTQMHTQMRIAPLQPVQMLNAQVVSYNGDSRFGVQLVLNIGGPVNPGPFLLGDTTGTDRQYIDSFFDVFFTLSPDFPALGTMDMTRNDAMQGGTFTSQFIMLPLITLAPAGGGPSTPQLPGILPYPHLQTALAPWVYVPYPGALPGAGPNFFPSESALLQYANPAGDPHTLQAAAGPPQVKAWRSLHLHTPGAPGADLLIPLDPLSFGNGTLGPVTESRGDGIERVQVDFDQPVQLTLLPSVALTGHLTVAGIMGPQQDFSPLVTAIAMIDADTLEVRMAGLPNEGCYRLDVAGAVESLSGLPLSGNTACNMRSLVGDADSSGGVDLSDALLIKSAIVPGPPAPASIQPRYDLNRNGGPINLADVLAAKARINQQALCP